MKEIRLAQGEVKAREQEIVRKGIDAMGNIQKALQRYVGFNGMDPVYCDRIEELMDKAPACCQDIEELYNKAEVHSINTSKG